MINLTRSIFFAFVLIACQSWASGGGSGGSSGAYDTTNYSIGKSVFFRKLYCNACPVAHIPLDRQHIEPIMPQLEAGGELGKLLSYRERYAVKHFLKARFELSHF